MVGRCSVSKYSINDAPHRMPTIEATLKLECHKLLQMRKRVSSGNIQMERCNNGDSLPRPHGTRKAKPDNEPISHVKRKPSQSSKRGPLHEPKEPTFSSCDWRARENNSQVSPHIGYTAQYSEAADTQTEVLNNKQISSLNAEPTRRPRAGTGDNSRRKSNHCSMRHSKSFNGPHSSDRRRGRTTSENQGRKTDGQLGLEGALKYKQTENTRKSKNCAEAKNRVTRIRDSESYAQKYGSGLSKAHQKQGVPTSQYSISDEYNKEFNLAKKLQRSTKGQGHASYKQIYSQLTGDKTLSFACDNDRISPELSPTRTETKCSVPLDISTQTSETDTCKYLLQKALSRGRRLPDQDRECLMNENVLSDPSLLRSLSPVDRLVATRYPSLTSSFPVSSPVSSSPVSSSTSISTSVSSSSTSTSISTSISSSSSSSSSHSSDGSVSEETVDSGSVTSSRSSCSSEYVYLLVPATDSFLRNQRAVYPRPTRHYCGATLEGAYIPISQPHTVACVKCASKVIGSNQQVLWQMPAGSTIKITILLDVLARICQQDIAATHSSCQTTETMSELDNFHLISNVSNFYGIKLWCSSSGWVLWERCAHSDP